MVSNVDLPLNALLNVVAQSASTDLLADMQRRSHPESTAATLLSNEPARWETLGVADKLQGESYTALCNFMRSAENQGKGCCGRRLACSSCRATRKAGCVCISWKDNMVQVNNGRGGSVWVKSENMANYTEKIAQETERLAVESVS